MASDGSLGATFQVGLPRECPEHGAKSVPGQAVFYFPITRMCCNVCGRMSRLKDFEYRVSLSGGHEEGSR